MIEKVDWTILDESYLPAPGTVVDVIVKDKRTGKYRRITGNIVNEKQEIVNDTFGVICDYEIIGWSAVCNIQRLGSLLEERKLKNGNE